MRHASLFSGIGGPEVAAAMLGWENVFHCEINEFGRKVLEYWFPNSESYEDITKTDFKKYRGKIDVLTGGFPCQPFSYAGKRRGQTDDRYLWPEMLRVINEVRPTWVIGENVAGIGTMVEQCRVVGMEGQAALFEKDNGVYRYSAEYTFTIERICKDLESEGYSIQPMLIPACAIGAPHRRDRIFFIAHYTNGSDDLRESEKYESESGKERLPERNKIRKPRKPSDVRPESEKSAENSLCDGLFSRLEEEQRDKRNKRNISSRNNERICGEERLASTDTYLQRCDKSEFAEEPRNKERFYCEKSIDRGIGELHPKEKWTHFPSVSAIHRGNDGLPFDVDNLSIPIGKWRTESIKAYGNAIVPQVMYRIFEAIERL
jgi:DNA (cytosine-5)-methyltransferase 1